MNEKEWLAARFETDRPRLRSVAYRVLGSMAEADDAVQEAWLRVTRSDASEVENMSGWLTTIVARVSLNMLQSRKSRREDLVDAPETDHADHRETESADPEQEALLAESVGAAMFLILDTLTPAERLAFVLHDMFTVPFEEIAPIVDRTPAAARQLASRARRRFQRQGVRPEDVEPAAKIPPAPPAPEETADTEGSQVGKADFVHAFLTASREGDFEALLSILAPDIVVRADQAAVRMGMATGIGLATGAGLTEEMRGADAVTRAFSKLSWAPVPALIDGSAGLAYVRDGVPHAVFRFDIAEGLITNIDIRADLTGLDIVILN
ncbi:sigma-70 family RNA polymerase sigma factor [Streptomyces sp. NBC_00140]|uniref:sigma-70 family RNA polymerase sigma factor n=1 Tax=Streptomyces sp. NBC_00140 TaxID=2975664 RepID=UPI00225662AF|nr:sigma-70 family RNA polymerase sigma factor [Streptomyces sp. NBC_00140]MCX5335454.1 sigma-70 family RNA polymerase sigma factor [Streptomyces sp. NBC_00140]MCX5338200.1 sigma-70 family RNA polymerase sigma factor [Streptomyces sp. NBC_00140]